MPRIPLLGGAYEAKSVIANAQRCINLFPEVKDSADSSAPVTHYPTPGLRAAVAAPSAAVVRCVYRASNGQGFAVVGSTVYRLSNSMVLTSIGSIGAGTTPVFMADNGLAAVIVDGTANGYAIDLATFAFAPIQSPYFYGGTRVQCIDNYLIFTQPGTNNWYISLALVTYQMLTTVPGSILTGAIAAPGSGYTDGTFTNQPLTGGTGTTAKATITVSGGAITAVTVTAGGVNYSVGDQLSADIKGVATGTIGAGAGYTDGSYTGTSLTGGTGVGAVADITVVGGAVTAVSITTAGAGYLVGDVLSASIPGGSGFTWTVLTLAATGTGFKYGVNTIGGSAFDALDIAQKAGYPDPLQSLIVMHKEIWLIGSLTTEIWFNSGAADFTFQLLPGAFIEHGTVAQYSVATQDLAVYWLGQDKQGSGIVFRGAGYAAQRISTFALEQALQSYGDITDAIGYIYQQDGHTFYVLNFPTADKTWVYDEASKLWHERAWMDADGNLHRHRGNCCANINDFIVVGDYENGQLYLFDTNFYTDVGNPIPRIRSFPHMLDQDERVHYIKFQADIEVGTQPTTTTTTGPKVSLRWSDDRGKTYSNAVEQSLGSGGQYLTNPQWTRLGMARDRVFELSWACDAKVALQGAFVTFNPMGS